MKLASVLPREQQLSMSSLKRKLHVLRFKDLHQGDMFCVEGDTSVYLKKRKSYSVTKDRSSFMLCSPEVLVHRQYNKPRRHLK